VKKEQQLKPMTVRVDTKLLERLKIKAVRQHISMQELVARAFELYLKRRPEANDEA
jgi:predicted HicB family RNase H-like nuclease